MTTLLRGNRDRGHAEWRHVHGHKHNGQATSRCASMSSRRICLVVCNLGYLLAVKAWGKLKRPVLIITENPDSSHKEAMAWSFTESNWDFGMLRWVRNQIHQPSRHWSHLHSKGYHSSQNALLLFWWIHLALQLGPEDLAVRLREANKEPDPEFLISLTQCLLQEYYTSRTIQHNNSPHGPPHHRMPGSASTQTFSLLWSLEYALREEKKTRR